MRNIWTHLTVDAPAADVWALLADLDRWPDWGPSVRAAKLDEAHLELEKGATGTLTTAVGVDLGFEITSFEPGTRWAWKVAGLDATDHKVEPLDDRSCRAGFGVPWVTAGYLAVCRIALHRIKTMAEQQDART